MKGSCLCGAIQYEVLGLGNYFGFDHCSRCRKATGSAFAAEVICNAAEFRWVSGSSLVKTYEALVRRTPPGQPRADRSRDRPPKFPSVTSRAERIR